MLTSASLLNRWFTQHLIPWIKLNSLSPAIQLSRKQQYTGSGCGTENNKDSWTISRSTNSIYNGPQLLPVLYNNCSTIQHLLEVSAVVTLHNVINQRRSVQKLEICCHLTSRRKSVSWFAKWNWTSGLWSPFWEMAAIDGQHETIGEITSLTSATPSEKYNMSLNKMVVHSTPSYAKNSDPDVQILV